MDQVRMTLVEKESANWSRKSHKSGARSLLLPSLVMWLLLNLHLLPSSSFSNTFASFGSFYILNILTHLLPPLSSSLRIVAMTNGTTVSQAEKSAMPSSKSILPSNVTDMELDVVTGQLTGTIMGLLPTLLENQTEAEKAQLGKQVKKEVERFFGELRTGGGEWGRRGKESEKKQKESSKAAKDECTSRPCNPKAVCIAIGANPLLDIFT